MDPGEKDLDVVIVGAGPAGLSAALVLGRARKRVLVIDDGPARNASAAAVHGFLGHDGAPPAELRRASRAELAAYPSVSFRDARAVGLARGAGSSVRVELADGGSLEARRVLLACGLVDVLPKIAGLREAWGRSAFSCPFCHGWELRDRAWGVLVIQKAMLANVPLARAWTREVVLLANGRTDLDPAAVAALERGGARVEARAIRSVIADAEGAIEAVELEDGARTACGAIWLHPGQRHVDLVLYAGLALDPEGLVRVDDHHGTSMRGVHACGDMASGAHPHAIQAAADGARAAIDLIELLTLERT